jgi:hypothetical protein
LVAVGVAVRLRLYAAGRAFWYDEAAVALNLVSRPLPALLAPLDYMQTAPPLFLWLERGVVLAAGAGEHALRAIAFIAGTILLVATWRLSRRLLPDEAALVALALVVFSPLLVYFANELKPYSSDALVTVFLLTAALRVGERPESRRRWAVLALGGAVGAGFSTTAPFVLAGVAAYLLLTSRVRRARHAALHAGLAAVIWIAAGAALFFVHREVMDDTSRTGAFMRAFWDQYFLTRDPPGLGERVWIAEFGAIKSTFLGGASRAHEMAALGLVTVLGLLRLVRRNGVAVGALVAVPFACLAIAAALRWYPLAPRLILFVAPLTALLIAGGATWLTAIVTERVSHRGGLVATAAVGFALLLVPARQALATFRNPPGVHELREMVRLTARARRTGRTMEPVWVSAAAEHSWRFYAGDSLRGVARMPRRPLAGTPSELAPGVLVGAWRHDGDRIVAEVTRLRQLARPCGWLLFALSNDEEHPAMVRAVTQLNGTVEMSERATGAARLRVCFGGVADTNHLPGPSR